VCHRDQRDKLQGARSIGFVALILIFVDTANAGGRTAGNGNMTTSAGSKTPVVRDHRIPDGSVQTVGNGLCRHQKCIGGNYGQTRTYDPKWGGPTYDHRH
jgi:hypothetical protein